MPVSEICVRDVVVATKETPVQEAARLMRQNHVGNLVVVDQRNGSRTPVGIVTDRDITVSVVATKLDPSVFTVGDLMGQELIVAQGDQGIFETIRQMRTHGIRRMPVISGEGDLIGIVSVDDLIQLLAEEMNELSKLISHEQAREAQLKQ
ncbi:MAG TPA: CBS domain-containing protein [Bryobacteraceae bacterium]|nr:CBS domain-containing protein [Bryobacteraceae bacterium]